MARNTNHITITGRTGKDVEIRYTPQGKQIGSVSLASNDDYTGADGVKHEHVNWFELVLWGKMAENWKQYVKKGSFVLVEGKIRLEKWIDPETQQVKYFTKIVVSNSEWIDLKKDDEAPSEYVPEGESVPAEAAASGTNEDEFPF